MVNKMKTLLTHKKSLNEFGVIPENVKEDMKLNNPESFNKTLINVTAEQEGAKGVEKFRYIYCSVCQQNKFPIFIIKFQAILSVKIENITGNCDSIKISISYLDLC